jgi:hypothetical protein
MITDIFSKFALVNGKIILQRRLIMYCACAERIILHVNIILNIFSYLKLSTINWP